MFDIFDCGCGGHEPDEDEVDEIVREIEEERGPELIPVEVPIPADDWPTRKPVEVE